MSFSRINYDSCAYDKKLAESTGPMEYLLGRPANPETCFVGSPQLRYDRGAVAKFKNKSIVDVDSELLGLNRPLGKCPKSDLLTGEKEEINTCTADERFLYAEDTKLSNPPCTLKGRGWNRWEWLCQNPQDKALIGFNTNMSDRTIAKDTHRPLLPTPVEATNHVTDDNSCYTDSPEMGPDFEFYKTKKPFFSHKGQDAGIVHWRSCDEISQL